MRVGLKSESPVIGRTLSDLLKLLQYEVAASDTPGIPQLHYTSGMLQVIAPSGSVLTLPRPASLQTIAAELRRLQQSARGAAVRLANQWRLEPLARMLHHERGQHVPLTEKETLLLSALFAAMPGAASREQLLKNVWAYAGDSETHTLETHIYRLRSKLAELQPLPADIVTEDGTYRLTLEG